MNFRYLGVPSSNIGGNVKRIDFSKKETWPIQELGRHDAQEALKRDEGFLFNELKSYVLLPDEGKPSLPDYLRKILDGFN